jgi:hypothetical protein
LGVTSRVSKSFYLSLKTVNVCISPIEIGFGMIWKIPRGPKGEKRPADVTGDAVKVMRIARDEETGTASSKVRPIQEGVR